MSCIVHNNKKEKRVKLKKILSIRNFHANSAVINLLIRKWGKKWPYGLARRCKKHAFIKLHYLDFYSK